MATAWRVRPTPRGIFCGRPMVSYDCWLVDEDSGNEGGILVLDYGGQCGYKELSENYVFWAIEDICEQKNQIVIRGNDRYIY